MFPTVHTTLVPIRGSTRERSYFRRDAFSREKIFPSFGPVRGKRRRDHGVFAVRFVVRKTAIVGVAVLAVDHVYNTRASNSRKGQVFVCFYMEW